MIAEFDKKKLAQSAFELAQIIIDECGPRISGDDSTIKASYLIEEDFQQFADFTERQNFDVFPKSFLGWQKILVFFYVISVLALWFNFSLISVILTTLGLLIVIIQFFYYIPLLDRFYRKKEGYNIIGTVEPVSNVKQQVIVSGHHDSAFIFKFLTKKPKLYSFRIFGIFGFIIIIIILSWLIFILELILGPLILFSRILAGICSFGAIFVIQLFFYAGNKGTPGAGDNLISVTTASQIGQFFSNRKKNGTGLNHTRVIIVSFDSEESGLRGARAYCKKYENTLTSIPSFNINLECLYNLHEMFFLTTDINGTVKLSLNLAKKMSNVAKSLGYSSKIKPIVFLTGGTDAAEFAKINVEATTLIGMGWGNSDRESVYHTEKDLLEYVDHKLVEASLEIVANFIMEKDLEASVE
jgi:hypothetical protein